MTEFTATMFIKDAQAGFAYPDSATGQLKYRSGIVEKVTDKVVTLKMMNAQTGAEEFKSFSYGKMKRN